MFKNVLLPIDLEPDKVSARHPVGLGHSRNGTIANQLCTCELKKSKALHEQFIETDLVELLSTQTECDLLSNKMPMFYVLAIIFFIILQFQSYECSLDHDSFGFPMDHSHGSLGSAGPYPMGLGFPRDPKSPMGSLGFLGGAPHGIPRFPGFPTKPPSWDP